MTFIYRQLKGVQPEFLPLVMATRLMNPERFPYPDVHVCKMSFRERAQGKLLRDGIGYFQGMSRRRQRHWRQFLQQKDVRLVHAHFGPSGLDVLPVVRALGIPLLVTFHGHDASKLLRRRMYVARLKQLFRYAHIITVSDDMADRLIGVGADPSRVTTHYIGAPVEDFEFVERRPLSEKRNAGEEIVCLQVSNFVEKKGHRYSIEAFREMVRVYPNSRLVLAGDGVLREPMMQLVRDFGLSEKVEFPGPVDKAGVISLMRDADIFLHHSVTASDGSMEGIPTVLMEAMATGLVVISTRHSGIPELIEDAVSGYLVDEKDVAEYGRTLGKALEGDKAIGARASEAVSRRFNLSKQNEDLKRIYRLVLASGELSRRGESEAAA